MTTAIEVLLTCAQDYMSTQDTLLEQEGNQRTLTIGEVSLYLRLVSPLTGLDTAVSVHTNNNIFSCLLKSNPVKLETSVQ